MIKERRCIKLAPLAGCEKDRKEKSVIIRKPYKEGSASERSEQ